MGFLGQGQLIFGSQDPRYGGGILFGYGRPEPRFQLGQIPAQLVYEGYADETRSPGAGGESPNETFAVGVLGLSRWRWPLDKNGNGVYVDLGWGLQFANQATIDLDSELNSTPVLGFGGTFKSGTQEYMIGLRYLHISNAGFKKPNDGQNELLLTFGVRY